MLFKPKPLYPRFSVDTLYSAFVEDYDSRFHFPGESHEMWELNCILDGAAGITSGTKVYECTSGDAFIHPGGLFHSAWALNDAHVRIMTVAFTGDGVANLVRDGKFTLTPFENRLADLLRQKIIACYHNIPPADCSTSDEEEQIVKCLLESLLLSLAMRADDRDDAPATVRSEDSYRFMEITAYMKQNVCENLTVEQICRDCKIGKSALKELFRRYTSTGTIKYFNYLRIRHAIKLLGRRISMAEIAREMNFSSQNYFSAFFKRETGMTPSEYRAEKLEGRNIHEIEEES